MKDEDCAFADQDDTRASCPHVAETELVGPARLEPAHPVAAHVAANVDPPEARRRKTVSGRRGAEVTWWRVT